MRVTGGSARGRRLKSPVAGTRPTSDLVRAAIYDVLAARELTLSPALDLYAGSGALGIEVLSRGGDRCDFVERDAKNASVIEENLRTTGLSGKGVIIRGDVARARDRLAGGYNLVLADPPYDDLEAPGVIAKLAGSDLVLPDCAFVLEQSSRRESAEFLAGLPRIWTRRYGDTQISIYRMDGMPDTESKEQQS